MSWRRPTPLPVALSGALAVFTLASAGAHAAIKYRSEAADPQIPPGQQSPAVIAKCPKGTHALGGGPFTSVGFAVVNQSLPWDNPNDPDAKPDDGWQVSMTNLSGIDAFVSSYVTCTDTKPRYYSRDTSFQGELSTGQSCVKGKVTGAGGLTTGGLQNTFLRTWRSFSSFGGNTQTTMLFKGLNTDTTVTVHAVCSDDLSMRYPVKPLVIGPNNGAQTTVRCRGGRSVVSGGAEQTTIGTGWELATTISIPTDAGDDDRKPDDGWRVSVNNPSGEQRTIQAGAACAG
jgi:hypothetical protein